MTTLITGANGFIGSWVTRLLAARGEPLRVLLRPGASTAELDGLPVQIVRGDLLDMRSLEPALLGVEHIIHAAGAISFKRRHAERVRLANFAATASLMHAARAYRVRKVVHVASIFSLGYAPGPDQLATEDNAVKEPELTNIPYVLARVQADQEAQDAHALGLPVVFVYPGVCLGPADHNRSSSGPIDAWLRGGLPALIRGGGICLVDVRDAAAALVAALDRGEPGRRYLVSGHNVTLPGLFEMLEGLAGRPAPRFQLGERIGVPLARAAELLRLFPAVDAGQARLMARLWWYDPARAVQELGVRFRPLQDTLRDTVTWLQAQR